MDVIYPTISNWFKCCISHCFAKTTTPHDVCNITQMTSARPSHYPSNTLKSQLLDALIIYADMPRTMRNSRSSSGLPSVKALLSSLKSSCCWRSVQIKLQSWKNSSSYRNVNLLNIRWDSQVTVNRLNTYYNIWLAQQQRNKLCKHFISLWDVWTVCRVYSLTSLTRSIWSLDIRSFIYC